MDDPQPHKGMPPRPEHGPRDGVALLLFRVDEAQQRLAVQPFQRQQALCGQILAHARHAHIAFAQNVGVERRMARLAGVIEFLAHAGADFLRHLAGVHGAVEAAAQGEEHVELLEIGLNHRAHVRVLQLAGEPHPVRRGRLVHLPERGRMGRLQVEGG